ncbi:MAG: hypothetical protein ACRAVC_22315 [Trichormus sp.]
MTFKNRLIRLIAPVLAVSGGVGISVPSMATNNDYQACAGRLLRLGLSEQAVSQACAQALRPRDLSACVVFIDKRTEISPSDALNACTKARQPKDLATCVVSVSKNTQESINPDVLNYCGRSLLPVRFAECVIGLRRQTQIQPNQALNTCINGSDRISGY